MHTIRISDETYRQLLARAESFDDTPEEVIARLLGTSDHAASPADATSPKRATPGSILPEQAYWRPILAIIEEAGGAMAANDVIEAVWERLHEQMRPRDLERQGLGEMRWRNRVRFARLRLKERGLLSDSSPRGIWEITEEGRGYLAGQP
jgi:hypothetical protein